jgi:hypothetical protein
MTTPTDPAQQFAQEMSYLQSELSSLQTKVQLSSPRGALEDLNTKIQGLPRSIQNLRDRNYVFEKGLTDLANSLIGMWGTSYNNVRNYLDQQAFQLTNAIRPIESQVNYAASQAGNPQYGLSMINSVKANIQTLESSASSVETTASGMYDQIKSEFDALNNHLDKVSWSLDRLGEASFPLLPTEAAIMAVKANWNRSGKEDNEDPQGILFLTDHRLIFEQNQEVAMKKVLFITTEKKKVQQLLLETPVNLFADIKANKGGFFKNEDFVIVNLGHGAPVPSAQFHVFGQDCTEWQALLKRAGDFEFDKDRIVPIDQTEVDKVKAAPTVCPACGGAITKPVMRGQDTITCDFCGNIIRL